MEETKTDWLQLILPALIAAVPLATAALAWLFQQMSQRAWNDYEKRRDAYAVVVKSLDALFGGNANKTNELLTAIRVVWLYGSDDVIRAWNSLSVAVKNNQAGVREQRYSEFILAIRQDLSRRKWLPPRKTTLKADDFQLESSGSGQGT